MYIFIVVVTIISTWSLLGLVSSRVEQASYTVLNPYTVSKSANSYEVRLYPAHIVAQTTVAGPYEQALSEGFSIVAGYIFGANTKKEGIAMTAPVVEQKDGNEKIPMTAPVTASLTGGSHTISFGMPRSYTLATLPTPTDSRVQIVTIPEKKMAVLEFSWSRSDSRVESKKQELLETLKRDGLSVTGEVQYAGYSAPWTPPWMMRNEVLVEIN